MRVLESCAELLESVGASSEGAVEAASEAALAIEAEVAAFSIQYVHDELFEDREAVHSIIESLPAYDGGQLETVRSGSHATVALPRTELLNSDSERRLFLRMNCRRFLAAQRQRLALQRGATSADLRSIRDLLAAADSDRNQIALSNQRLVVSIAMRFASPEFPVSDLSSEGNLTLLRSINLFDVSRGFRFSTYATHSIRRHLSRVVRREQRAVTSAGEAIPEPTIEESECEWIDVHPGELVSEILEGIPERERRILEMRFGLCGNSESMTYREIAGIFGLSTERVRQLTVAHCRKAYSRYGQRLGLS